MLSRIVMFIYICTSLILISCGRDFVNAPLIEDSPTLVNRVSPEELITAIQPNAYYTIQESAMPLLMWMQQINGIAAQNWNLDGYRVQYVSIPLRRLVDNFYRDGGLIDIRIATSLALEQNKNHLAGILMMWEALLISTAAEYWGDIPYSQAVNHDIEFPKPDKQSEIYTALHLLVDTAISEFESESKSYDTSIDYTYNGNTQYWIGAANTLKARMYLNCAELDFGNYQKALDCANRGISVNWKCKYSLNNGEHNFWYHYQQTRWGYITAGGFIVDLMLERNDPRTPFYFAPNNNGGYSGGYPQNGSYNNSFISETGIAAPDWDADLVSVVENYFIMAECYYMLGNEYDAINSVEQAHALIESINTYRIGSLPRYRMSGLTGPDLLEVIMIDKYLALFLQPQVWSDWRRTAFPIFTITSYDQPIPRRYPFYYVGAANPNMPLLPYPDNIYKRNENDPGDPVYPGKTINQ